MFFCEFCEIFRAVENSGAKGAVAPQIFANFYFGELKKNSVKGKIVQNYKTTRNSSKFIDIYKIIIDLDTRDSILPVMNSERYSHFQPFTHYSTTHDTTYAI